MNSSLRRPLLCVGLTCALVLASSAGAEACGFGWCRSCRASRATVATYVAACPAPVAVPVAVVPAYTTTTALACPAPQPFAVVQTCMTQRCYLAPVTTLQTRTAYQNVTTYRTSYYLEPVTTMRTSAYYDPCTCSYYNVATPVTTYVRRARVEPIITTVARNYVVPVTTYERRCVTEPITRIQYYYPGQPPVAVVPTPTVAQYWTPVPAAVVTPGTAQGQGPQLYPQNGSDTGNPGNQPKLVPEKPDRSSSAQDRVGLLPPVPAAGPQPRLGTNTTLTPIGSPYYR